MIDHCFKCGNKFNKEWVTVIHSYRKGTYDHSEVICSKCGKRTVHKGPDGACALYGFFDEKEGDFELVGHEDWTE